MRNGLRILLTGLILSGFWMSNASISSVWACPFCEAPSTTLGEQLNTSHVAVLAAWHSAQRPDAQTFEEGTTTYKVIALSPHRPDGLQPGQTFVVDRYHSGRIGDEFLLFASKNEDKLTWGLPSPVSRECWKYLISAPLRSLPSRLRLPYYLANLENSDPDISMDAYGEFASIPYEGLLEVADQLPREKLIKWLSDPLVIPARRGLYGLMLGLCGKPEDALFLKEIIWQQPEESRLGIDGMMAGYLLLTGPEGLRKLTACKFSDPETPVHEVYAMLQTLRFMWTYGRDTVDAVGLRNSMRELLSHSQFAGLVILDLARWKDWEIMDQLVAGYGEEPFADSHARQSIVRYLMIAEQEGTSSETALPNVNDAAKAKSYLEKIRQTDPRIIKYVENHPFD